MKIFDSIKVTKPRSNKFDLSHERKFTCQPGQLTPILCMETLPGDKIRCSSEIFMRMLPLIAPIMHRVNVYVHFFKVPYRLIWDEWEKFITGGRLGDQVPVSPFISYNTANAGQFGLNGSLADFLGWPTATAQGQAVPPVLTNQSMSALPFRAYQLIYDEYYRDQNVTPEVGISKASGEVLGAELAKLSPLRKRAWEKDYFTSALPWAQRGAAVNIPFGSGGVVYRASTELVQVSAVDPTGALTALPFGAADGRSRMMSSGGITPLVVDNIQSIALTGTINDLRRSMRLQEWLEKNARGGARYTEQLLHHFGVVSSDARLQRPQYLGGGMVPVTISEVVSNFQSYEGEDITSQPQGNMAGHGAAVGRSNSFDTYCEEHCIVMGLLSFLPRTAYQQGIPRYFQRADKFDYYFPEFQNIGEQEVKYKELYYNASVNTDTPEATFGYQSRFSEYRYIPSTVHGAMKDNLSFWHLGRIFGTQPGLNTTFIESDNTGFQRAQAVTVDQYAPVVIQCYNRLSALRPMSYHATPSL